MLKKARSMDMYNVQYIKEMIVYVYKENQFQQMYLLANEWTDIQPMEVQGYESSMLALYEMYKKGDIELEQLEMEKSKLFNKVNIANKKRNRLSKYIANQSIISIDEEWKAIFESR
ncbi:MAG: hypothetical protein GX066_02835 [Clostridiaceae bacterium]|nr:hypothetical protein [Clostridiaceae bacterium]